MSLHIIMSIGGLLIVIAVAGSVVLTAKSVIKAIKILFLKQPDIQITETDEEKRAAKKILKWALGSIAVLGMILFIPCAVLLYAPRGFDSLFSKNSEEIHTGDDTEEMQQKDGDKEGIFFLSEEKQDRDVLVVEGRTVRFEGHIFENMEKLEAYLENVNENRKIRLKDDYAIAATFHQVEDFMKEKGISYSFYDEADGEEE